MINKKQLVAKLTTHGLSFLTVLALCLLAGCWWGHGGRR